jgi:hypothetical protein
MGTRYTLALPTEVYDELREQSEKRGTSIKELVRQSLKLGLVAMRLEAEDGPDAGIFIKEVTEEGVVKETKLVFL